jgi:hypothetical protein
LILLAIVAIGVLPLLAALYFRYVSPPEVKATVGQPLDPIPLPFEFLQRSDGAALEHPAVSGKWLLIFVAPGGCDERCQHTLYLTRQARTAQGRNVARLDRLWLITDAGTPAKALMAAHPDLVMIRRRMPKCWSFLAARQPQINLVDRRGLRFPLRRRPRAQGFHSRARKAHQILIAAMAHHVISIAAAGAATGCQNRRIPCHWLRHSRRPAIAHVINLLPCSGFNR